MIISWERDDRPYANGSIGRLGKIQVFYISRAMIRDEGGNWTLGSRFPGIKHDLGNYESQEKAMAMAEQVLRTWFRLTGTCMNKTESE